MVLKLESLRKAHPVVFKLIVSAVVSFLTVMFASFVASFLYPLASNDPYHNDSSMFYLMGKLLAEGHTPYLEVFDHKGLYIFYYTALGYLLGGKAGMFIVQFLTFGAFYYAMQLVCEESGFGVVKTLACCLLLEATFGLVQMYPSDYDFQLPFIALTFYFYAKAQSGKGEKYFLLGNAFAGITAGIALNSRPSDAMIPFSIVVYYFFHELLNKEQAAGEKAKKILLNALVCLGGLIFACLPPLIHAAAGGFLPEMLDIVILSNFRYVGASADRNGGSAWICRGVVLGVMALIFLTLYLKRKELSKDEMMFHIVSTIVVGLAQFLIAYYPHYFVIVAPYGYLFFLRMMGKFDVPRVAKYVVYGLTLASNVLAWIYPVTKYYVNEYAKDVAITEYVDSVIPEEDRNGHVLTYNYPPGIYLNCNITPSFPDFSVQNTHQTLGVAHVSKEALMEHLKSGECHYFILEANLEKLDEVATYVVEGVNGVSSFAKIDPGDRKGGEYIEIYHYVG